MAVFSKMKEYGGCWAYLVSTFSNFRISYLLALFQVLQAEIKQLKLIQDLEKIIQRYIEIRPLRLLVSK